jgi:chemosensory pili system protein ChpE
VSSLGSLAADGFLLGWSVAWPPGPINAEMIRRGLTAGFRPAFSVGLGACSGDAIWAIAVTLGIGLVLGPNTRFALALISTILLTLLGALFLIGAWQAWRHVASQAPPQSPPAGTRSGYLLGLGMALTSPWNFAFWLAVMGRSQSLQGGVNGTMTLAGAVILGAASWCLLLCGAMRHAQSRLAGNRWGPLWQIIAKGLTGILMLGFAAQQWRVLSAG